MPLKYPDQWKFDGFDHEIPPEAHREFSALVGAIAEGVDRPQTVFEDFKTAYGYTSGSSNASWAESDLDRAMEKARENAARYVVSFYAGLECVRDRGIGVPTVKKINRILATHGVPLAIEGQHLVLTAGDIEFAQPEDAATLSNTAFVRGPVIGRGGFGVVYQITRKTKIGDYHYAMKVLDPHVFVTDQGRAEKRFKREMEALERLQHRGIIPFLEAGYDPEQRPYILMPYVDGSDLRDSLAGAEPDRVFRIFDEILRAIEFAHAQGVVHRDLKPKNILVRSSDDQPLILDFGCAYLLDDLDDSLTTNLIGTSAYVPEEVLRDHKNRSVTQDVYACGVLLYEVIAGRHPKHNEYEPIEEDIEGYPGIDQLIQAALAPERKRIKTANVMRQRLAKLAQGI